MKFSLHPEAEVELNQAVDHYQAIESGLGREFTLEVLAAIRRAVEFPKAWSVLEGDVRRSLVRRFPFGVLYAEESVVAVMNLHREPRLLENSVVWRNSMKDELTTEERELLESWEKVSEWQSVADAELLDR